MARAAPLDLKKIRKVQITMDHLATDLLAGIYRSAFKGRGMEFEEVREFQPGDEERSIDWNVTARMGTPYIKLFREERELTIILMIDISASNRFGAKNALKSTVLSEISGALAFSGIKNQDKIGLVLYTDKIELYLPPAKGIRHVLRLIRECLAFEPKNRGTKIETALSFLGKVQKKRAVVFILSDFLIEKGGIEALPLLAKKHDVIGIGIHDPLEKSLPNVGLLPLKDLESDEEQMIDTSSKALRSFLENDYSARREFIKKSFERCGASFVEVATNTSFILPLRKFFASRGQR